MIRGRPTLEAKKQRLLDRINEKTVRSQQRAWRPTAKQRLYLDTLVSAPPGSPLNKYAISKQAHISYVSVVNWHKDERFLNWLDLQRTRLAEEKLEAVWKAMYDKAVEGNVPAAKLFVERFDKDYKPIVKNETDVTHHLPELSEDQQGELERARDNFQKLLTVKVDNAYV